MISIVVEPQGLRSSISGYVMKAAAVFGGAVRSGPRPWTADRGPWAVAGARIAPGQVGVRREKLSSWPPVGFTAAVKRVPLGIGKCMNVRVGHETMRFYVSQRSSWSADWSPLGSGCYYAITYSHFSEGFENWVFENVLQNCLVTFYVL